MLRRQILTLWKSNFEWFDYNCLFLLIWIVSYTTKPINIVNKIKEAPIGLIAIDSIFTPIKNVKYNVEDFRVEQRTDFEKLVMEVTSDGSIHPEEALKEAAKILIQHFVLF